ncbi:MAG: hypothetical protein K2L86_09230 [Lachnospiraceae bacterium]|nr:hypothetical protein [Lachnospiraceae bacterium]
MSACADGCPAREQGKLKLLYSIAHGLPEEVCQPELTGARRAGRGSMRIRRRAVIEEGETVG